MSASEPRNALEQARALVERWLPEIPADAHELHRARMRFALAELELALGRETGERSHVTRADSLLLKHLNFLSMPTFRKC